MAGQLIDKMNCQQLNAVLHARGIQTTGKNKKELLLLARNACDMCLEIQSTLEEKETQKNRR
jgi:hypothetical protein